MALLCDVRTHRRVKGIQVKKSAAGRDVVFLSAVRTPFGTFGGSLRDVSAIELAVHASKTAIQRSGINATDIDQVVFGNVLYTSSDSIYFSRHVALKSGCRVETPALTVNRLCGSGFQAIVSAAAEIMLGKADACLVGGADSMSQAPHVARGLRWGVKLGQAPTLDDLLWESLKDSYCGLAMGETAENLAVQYKLDRTGIDEFALRSQQLAHAAWNSGAFDEEVVAIPVKKLGQDELFSRDEHIRPDTTAEGLARLKPVFKPSGVVTAGNASGIGDGAAALVICSTEYAESKGLKPFGKLRSWGIAGVDPSVMGIGPVPASRNALADAEMSLDQMDLIEVNEAFAAQACAVEKELAIPREKFNLCGGAVALSHPLAASGARITAHLLHTLKRTGKRFGLGAACIGGGQGMALIVESMN